VICRVYYRYRKVKDHGTQRQSLYEIVPEYRYSLTHYGQTEIDLPGATWADLDFRTGALVARDGKLFTVTVTDQLKLSFTELADFNAHKPANVKTPDWAKKW
jgi:hypothetical protein